MAASRLVRNCFASSRALLRSFRTWNFWHNAHVSDGNGCSSQKRCHKPCSIFLANWPYSRTTISLSFPFVMLVRGPLQVHVAVETGKQGANDMFFFSVEHYIAFIVLHHELPIRFRQIYRQRQSQTKHQRHHYLRPLDGVRRDVDANVLAEPVHFVPFCWRTIQIAPGNSLDSCRCLPIILICANKDDGIGDDANSPQNKASQQMRNDAPAQWTIAIIFSLIATRSGRNEIYLLKSIHFSSKPIPPYQRVAFDVSQEYAQILDFLFFFPPRRIHVFWQLHSLPRLKY